MLTLIAGMLRFYTPDGVTSIGTRQGAVDDERRPRGFYTPDGVTSIGTGHAPHALRLRLRLVSIRLTA